MIDVDSLLTENLKVSPSDLEKAKAYQQKYGGRLEKLLVNMGSLSEQDLTIFYRELLSMPISQLNGKAETWEQPDWSADLDMTLLVKHGWLPSSADAENDFYTFDPLSFEANQYLSSQNRAYTYQLLEKNEFDALKSLFQEQQEQSATTEILSDYEEDKLRELATEAPTVNLLNGLITKGVLSNASDLHLEPYAGRYRVRYRIDGVLQDDSELPVSLQLAVISRIKILANMDIAEKRRPQDGKIETKVANTELDIRVSALPLGKGESVVMRFLRKDSVRYDMATLGISPDIELKIKQDLKATSGVILLTGPTGSGKTTSLYTFLHELNSEHVKIITLEDPIEYQLEGVNQVQVNSEIGFDFSAGLRSIVRQDPDIIMVGEIRDRETAQIALQSALTGHLVFSTVHTNDAPSAFTRLIDLGVEEFLLNAAIVSIVAQRLVRRVCPHCATEHEHKDALIEEYQLNVKNWFDSESVKLVQANGCSECGNTGYKGRMSILEYLPITDDIRTMSKDANFLGEAKLQNAKLGNRTLLEDGLFKACQGLTTVDEVLRVCA